MGPETVEADERFRTDVRGGQVMLKREPFGLLILPALLWKYRKTAWLFDDTGPWIGMP